MLLQVLDQILSSEMGRTQGNREHQAKETEFIAAMLCLTVGLATKHREGVENEERRMSEG